MAELGIAASVTGLLAVAGKVSTIIFEFVSSVADAPKSAQSALATIEELRMIFASIKLLLDNGLSRIAENRKKMIHITNLVIIFRESIISLSELEAIMSSAPRPDEPRFKWNQVRWVFEQEKFERCVQRLESHKTSLSAMLSILHCESEFEAQQCLRTLQDTVQLLLEQNQAILHRLEQCNLHLRAEDVSVRFLEDDVSTIRGRTSFHEDTWSASRLPGPSISEDSTRAQAGANNAHQSQDFESTLKVTRVYRRVRSSQCDVSFRSSVVRSHAWSALSNWSLSDISVISVIALPISLEEINQIGQHLTFANMLYAPETHETAMSETSLPTYRILVMGDTDIALTTLTVQFCVGHFINTYEPTIEDSYRKQVQLDGESCILEVRDTAAHQSYAALRDEWIRDGEGFVLVYSVCKRSTFTRVQEFYDQIVRAKSMGTGSGSQHRRNSFYDSHPAPTMLVGNNCDWFTKREVPTREGAELAKILGCQFVETSVKTRIGVEKVFCDVARVIRQQRNNQQGRGRKLRRSEGARILNSILELEEKNVDRTSAKS